MSEPKIAAKEPCEVELIEGKSYFFCTCGQSENQPFCDGAHKGTDFTPHKFTCDETKKAWLCQCKRTDNVPFCDGSHNKISD